MCPELHEYGTSRASRELDAFLADVRAEFKQAERVAFERHMRSEWYRSEYERGYEEGRRAGVDKAFGRWVESVKGIFAILASFFDPVTLAKLTAGAIDVYTSPQGTPIPPELRRRMEATRWYAALKELAPTLDRLNRMTLLEGLDWAAAEVLRAMKAAGVQWVRTFFALNGRPYEQGRHAGELIGKACGEVVVAAIEEVATAGVGHLVLGPATSARLAKLADAELPTPHARPQHLDETVREAIDQVAQSGRLAASVAGEGAEAATAAVRFVERLKERLGGLLDPVLDSLTDADWMAVVERARAIKGGSDDVAARMVKGELAELLIPELDEFGDLVADVARRAPESRWSPPRHSRSVTAAAPAPGEADLALSDGVLYVLSKDPRAKPKLWVLAVFESKSPSNLRDLVRAPRGPGDEAKAWAGQFHSDFERFSELPVTIDGVTYAPDEMLVSRDPRLTEWVAVTPRDKPLTRKALDELALQGFSGLRQWRLPVGDTALNRIAVEIVRLVRR